MSVVMTCGELADRDFPLFLPPPLSSEVGELRDEDDDIADGWMLCPWYTRPFLNGGASYVTPKSGCLQKGQAEGSDTNMQSS